MTAKIKNATKIPNNETLKAIKDSETLEAKINKDFKGKKGVICEMDNGELRQYQSLSEVWDEIEDEIKNERSLNA